MNEFIEKLIGRLEEEKEYCSYNPKIRDEAINKAIEIVNQLAEEYGKDNNISISEYEKGYEDGVESVRALLPYEEKKVGWIPCSERLPEEGKKVLTCTEDGWISVNINMPYNGRKNDFQCGYYVAWMPLPDPYIPNKE